MDLLKLIIMTALSKIQRSNVFFYFDTKSFKSADGICTMTGSASLPLRNEVVFVSPIIVSIMQRVSALPFDLLLPVCERRRHRGRDTGGALP